MKGRISIIWRLLPVFLIFLILFEAAAFVATTPKPRESFFEFYVLGSNRTGSNYYPNNSSSIRIDQRVTWYVGVSNQMGTIQLVDVQVKLGNQTIDTPNDTTGNPSSAPLITGLKHFMQDNETWEIPFIWSILNVTATSDGQWQISRLQIDNVAYDLADSPVCSNTNSCRLRIIFELWTWNTDSASFQFGWWDKNQPQITWLQVWFSATPGAR